MHIKNPAAQFGATTREADASMCHPIRNLTW